MRVGFSKTEITPPIGVALAGFEAPRIADEIFHELYVKVVLWEVDGELSGVISYDLIAVDHFVIDTVKKELKRLKLDPNRFIFTATHTHSGPQGMIDTSHGFLKSAAGVFGLPDRNRIRMVAKQTIRAITNSIELLEDGEIRISKGRLHGLGANRNDADLKGDENLLVMEVCQRNKKAVVAFFACHPTILSFDSLSISGDFPSVFYQEMELAGYEIAMFVNGSCGDISTRFTREGTGKEELINKGKLLAKQVKKLLLKAKVMKITSNYMEHFEVELLMKEADLVDAADEKVKQSIQRYEDAIKAKKKAQELRTLASYKEGAMANYRYALSSDGQSSIKVPITIFEIGKEMFVCIPGELFSELSNQMIDEHTHFITYANGYLMYFANRYAFEHHYYEAYSSPFKMGESEMLMKNIKERLERRK